MASYLHTTEKAKILYDTIPERLRSLAEKYPNKPAIVSYDAEYKRHQITLFPEYQDRSAWKSSTTRSSTRKRSGNQALIRFAALRYLQRKEMYDGAVKFAKALMKLGIKKGETVAYCVPNCVEWMSYDIGIMMTGAYSMRLMFGLSDMKSVLEGCSAVVLGSKSIWDSFLSIAQINDNGKVSSKVCPDLRLAIDVSNIYRPPSALSAAKLMAEISDNNTTEFPYIDPEEIAAINQTSGTTGTPKRICHSHFNYLNVPDIDLNGGNVSTPDVIFNSRPMGYIGGYPFFVITKGTLYVTGDVQMLNDTKNFDFVVNLWNKEKCTIVGVAPQNLKRIGNRGFRIDTITSGGDLLTRDAIEHSFKIADQFEIIYGSTETMAVSYRIFTPESISEYRQGMLGRPINGTEIKIVDDEKRVVDIGNSGHLYFRSKWTTKTYLDGTSCLENGWYSTSDICYLTKDGDLMMIGRSTDFIKKCTVKLSIKLIENYVGRHPSVESVVVVPIPDEGVGERVCVCVTIVPDHKFNEDELKKFCTETMPEPSNFDCVSIHPDYILCFPSFPYLASGKFDRKTITTLAVKRVKESNKH